MHSYLMRATFSRSLYLHACMHADAHNIILCCYILKYHENAKIIDLVIWSTTIPVTPAGTLVIDTIMLFHYFTRNTSFTHTYTEIMKTYITVIVSGIFCIVKAMARRYVDMTAAYDKSSNSISI